MAAATTTSTQYKTHLLTALKARSGLTGVQLEWGFPGDTLRAQAMYFGKVTADVATPVMAGPRVRREENYTVELLIDVCDGSNDLSKAETTAFGILGEVDDQVAGDASSASLVKMSHVSHWESRPYFDETRRGWAVLLTVEIAVMARLT